MQIKVIDTDNEMTVYELEAAPTILLAFENAGFQYPHGCRVGVCGSCISEVISGEENLPQADSIERRRLEELKQVERTTGQTSLQRGQIRFPCRTALTAPVTLRPISGSVRRKPIR